MRAQWVEAPGTRSDNLSLTLRDYTVEGENRKPFEDISMTPAKVSELQLLLRARSRMSSELGL